MREVKGIKWLYSGKVCLFFTFLFLLYLFVFLPNESKNTAAVTGGLTSPDTTFFYTSSDLQTLISQYTDDARRAYVASKIRFDILWSLAYGACLVSLLGFSIKVLRKYGKATSGLFTWLPILPVVSVVFDYLENIAVSISMLTFPDSPAVALMLAPLFTLIKWSLLNGSMVLALCLAAYAGFTKLRKYP